MTVVTAAMDERLNEKGYIVPGLGDAGDRLYGVAAAIASSAQKSKIGTTPVAISTISTTTRMPRTR